MWRTVERLAYFNDCVERRGRVSTAYTPRRKFGTVLISDGRCGNGTVVLAKRRGRPGPWRILGSGSDWGYPGRCASDLERIPLRVLQDFFGDDVCADYRPARGVGVVAARSAKDRPPQILCLSPATIHIYPARRPRRCVIQTVLGPTRLDLREMRWRRWGNRAAGHGQLFLREEGIPDVRGETGWRGRVSVRLKGRSPTGPPHCFKGRWYGRAILRVKSGPDRGRRIPQRLTGGCPA